MLTAEKIARHLLHVKCTSNRPLQATIACSAKVTIICSTEEASSTDRIFSTTSHSPWHSTSQFILLMGDHNGRIWSSGAHPKSTRRYTYHQVTSDNGKDS